VASEGLQNKKEDARIRHPLQKIIQLINDLIICSCEIRIEFAQLDLAAGDLVSDDHG
jgi:hypothetical protein